MNVLRLGMEVEYRGLRGNKYSGVIRALDNAGLVWCGSLGEPLHRCYPVPYRWVRAA